MRLIPSSRRSGMRHAIPRAHRRPLAVHEVNQLSTDQEIKGALHAKTHLRERLPESKRLSVLTAISHPALGRVGNVIAGSSRVPRDKIVLAASLCESICGNC
jgi:hypothetical protein